jgi:hypothetical protein
VQLLSQDLILEGFDVQQLLLQLLDHYNASVALPDIRKARIAEVIAETDIKLLQGGDEELNLMYALSNVAKIIKLGAL